ncbi:putative lysozyme g-like [Scophthalmus maximus]|uniref:Putative lysozyme g-like n=1 Tax=Scophthalmus maximus TaxID=52904 RepID=A0A2U9B0A8_SCOMX|nr:putative lysozyme g-like [Scophthalmus maximus]
MVVLIPNISEVSDVNVTVQRTSSNQLLVHCESSGWSPKPLVSLLNANGDVLPAQREFSVGPDQLYSVGAHLEVEADKDEFRPVEACPECWIYAVLPIVFIIATVTVLLLGYHVNKDKLKKWRSALWSLKEKALASDDRYKVYGDVLLVETTGASDLTVDANKNQLIVAVSGQLLSGVAASEELARSDLAEMAKYKRDIVSVGQSLSVHPALIAAIISRQSRAGTSLKPGGFGKTDPNCFGLMQINKHYHAVKGNPHSRDHVDQGVTFLIQLLKTMRRKKPNWTPEQQLKGALGCYISGEEKIIPLARPEEVDGETPRGDFPSDVVARAHWFARNGY